MPDELLSSTDAARRLGISRASLYGWLDRSDAGTLILQGQPVTVGYFQTGAKGQGRIKIEVAEVDRLKELMRVHPRPSRTRRPAARPQAYPGITVKLGYPPDCT
jgi:hypothetical protein